MNSARIFRAISCSCRSFQRPSNLTSWRLYKTNTALLRKEAEETVENDEPVRYSTSQAHGWHSAESFTPPPRDQPWYQMYSVLFSISAFLLYFLVLREENDMDEEIGKSLYERIPGLEEQQLVVRIKYDQEKGNDTSALWARLNEIRSAPGYKPRTEN